MKIKPLFEIPVMEVVKGEFLLGPAPLPADVRWKTTKPRIPAPDEIVVLHDFESTWPSTNPE